MTEIVHMQSLAARRSCFIGLLNMLINGRRIWCRQFACFFYHTQLYDVIKTDDEKWLFDIFERFN